MKHPTGHLPWLWTHFCFRGLWEDEMFARQQLNRHTRFRPPLPRETCHAVVASCNVRSQVLEVSSRTLIAVVRCTSAFTGCGILSYLRGNTVASSLLQSLGCSVSPQDRGVPRTQAFAARRTNMRPRKAKSPYRSDGRAHQHCSGRARAALCRPRATLGRLWCAFNPRVLSPPPPLLLLAAARVAACSRGCVCTCR